MTDISAWNAVHNINTVHQILERMLKFMKRRKLISSLLAAALTLGLAVPAFAEGDVTLTGANNSTTITVGTTLNVPEINVVLAPLPGMVINPYKLDYNYNGSTVSDSLISAPALITNNSKMKIKVSAKPYVSVTGGVNFVDTKSGVDSAGDAATAFVEFMYATTVNKDNLASTGTSPSTWPTEGTVVKSSTNGSEVAPIDLTLAAATAGATESDPTTPAYGAYKIQGATGGKSWSSDNKFTVTILFDIEPVIGS